MSGSEKDLTAISSRWCKSSKPCERSNQRNAGGVHTARKPWNLGTRVRKHWGFCLLAYQKLVKNVVQNALCIAKNPLVFFSEYENCSPPGMCENPSLIERVLPLWQTLQERRDSCAEPGCDWQSLSDPSEITSRVGAVSLEINTAANVQRLKIRFPFTLSLPVLHPSSPFSCPVFPPFYKQRLCEGPFGTPTPLCEAGASLSAVADCSVSPPLAASAEASCKITEPSDPSALRVVWQSLPWFELLSFLLFFFPSCSASL